MKSFAKFSLLFALIIVGRYLQPMASAPLATRVTPATQVLPLALARYTATPSLPPTLRQPAQPPRSYFL
ncbi:MAG: hypothetical protein ACRYG7_44185 [Janthinobacterium lividum]